jgi:hypothetical protein
MRRDIVVPLFFAHDSPLAFCVANRIGLEVGVSANICILRNYPEPQSAWKVITAYLEISLLALQGRTLFGTLGLLRTVHYLWPSTIYTHFAN